MPSPRWPSPSSSRLSSSSSSARWRTRPSRVLARAALGALVVLLSASCGHFRVERVAPAAKRPAYCDFRPCW